MPALIFLFGFFLYIYCEISLLVSVGSSIGVLPLILLMIAISAAGIWLIKLRGMVTIWQIRKQVGEGKIPTDAVISSVFYAVAGVLLLIPGFLSDILAILLLLPFTRTLFKGIFAKFFAHKFRFVSFGSTFQHRPHDSNTFDAEFERKQDEDKWIK
ncbi:MAG: FxsA family protein [Pasteurellaceae bacterium]|nr:FxsA family protein [Pasteurellaceae bacterium]